MYKKCLEHLQAFFFADLLVIMLFNHSANYYTKTMLICILYFKTEPVTVQDKCFKLLKIIIKLKRFVLKIVLELNNPLAE
ncbi:hypothetical protein [Metabacillus sp. YM-086]|uniref:hypothetical protein n=1 Tax=Metabacillus sp. YM-086 TaxID=3341729 RepID=UPI003A873DC8